jgi:methylamine dehydrogenase accessory protein MauD
MQTFQSISLLALSIIVVIQGIILLALARQIGVLHSRISPQGARIVNAGPRIGDPAPPVNTQNIHHQIMTLGSDHGKSTLLLFITPGCSVCAALLPSIKKLANDERKTLEVKLLAFGTNVEAAEMYFAEHELASSTPLAVADDLAMQYRVTLSPYGIIVDRDGIIRSKGIVNSYEHVESLLNALEMGVRSFDDYMDKRNRLGVDGI